MLPRLLAVLLATAVSAGAQSVEHVAIKGAYAKITVPADWNGGLFIYAHGYTSDERVLGPIPDDLAQANLILFPGLITAFVPSGYATAVTTFRSTGWDVKDAIKDVENLRRYFTRKHGKPTYTYLWGHSEGGMITETVIERFPDTYDGAAPMCATGAGARRLFDAEYDLRVLYEYVCRDVPDARFVCGVCTDQTSRCVEDSDCPAGQTCGATEAPPAFDDGLTRECFDFLSGHPDRLDGAFGSPFVARVIAPCIGGAPPSPAQAARRDLLVRATQLPDDQLDGDLFFASFGLAEMVYRRTDGKRPWGNVGVRYTSPLLTADEEAALDAGVHRSDSDAAAVRWVRRFYEPRGRTSTKVVTLHALDDGLVIPEHEEKYRQAFEAAGSSEQLVQFFTPGGEHCANYYGFRPALEQLVAWVEHGQTPTAASMDAACGGCLSAARPGPFGVKVPERRQDGAPLRTIVCTGEAGDCPPGTACAAAKDHCE